MRPVADRPAVRRRAGPHAVRAGATGDGARRPGRRGDRDGRRARYGDASQGFVRLLVVAPEHRGRGVGRELLVAGEDDLRAAGLHVGDDRRGRAVLPVARGGGDARPRSCTCSNAGSTRAPSANYNMDVDLADIPADDGGWVAATAADRDEVEAWAEQHWGWWTAELVRAAERDTLVISRDDAGITAVCAYDVTRAGWVGPVAVRPDLMGRGVGVPRSSARSTGCAPPVTGRSRSAGSARSFPTPGSARPSDACSYVPQGAQVNLLPVPRHVDLSDRLVDASEPELRVGSSALPGRGLRDHDRRRRVRDDRCRGRSRRVLRALDALPARPAARRPAPRRDGP